MMTAIALAGASVLLALYVGGKRAGGTVATVEVCVLSFCVQDALRVRRFYGKKA